MNRIPMTGVGFYDKVLERRVIPWVDPSYNTRVGLIYLKDDDTGVLIYMEPSTAAIRLHRANFFYAQDNRVVGGWRPRTEPDPRKDELLTETDITKVL